MTGLSKTEAGAQWKGERHRPFCGARGFMPSESLASGSYLVAILSHSGARKGILRVAARPAEGN